MVKDMLKVVCPNTKIFEGQAIFLLNIKSEVIYVDTKLKRILDERGIKQGFIADKAGLSRGAFSLIVRGKSIPTLPAAIKIARALNETVESLWGDLVK